MLPRYPVIVTAVLLAMSADAGEPRLGPLSGIPPAPADNPVTAEKVALEKELFFDDIFSGQFRADPGVVGPVENAG